MKAAFVVPVHPPKFSYALGLLESFDKFWVKADLFFVFSCADDLVSFRREARELAPLFEPIIAEYAGLLESPVTYKKWYGLDYVFGRGYDYAAAVDCEALFTKEADVCEAFRAFHEQKVIHSCEARNFEHVQVDSSKFFSVDEVERLGAMTDNFAEYFWFNDIPAYEAGCFSRFADRLKIFDSGVEKRFGWWNFDYVVYGYYLLLYEGYSLDKMTEALGAFDKISVGEGITSMPPLLRQHFFERTQPMWVLAKVDPAEHPSSAFMVFHVDRPLF